MKNKKVKQVLIILGVAVTMLVLYAIFTGGLSQVPESGLVSVRDKKNIGTTQYAISEKNLRIVRILNSVKDIQLNDNIFQNPLFRSLKDTQFTIPRPIKIGRINPFLPIGADVVEGGSTTTSSDLDTSSQGNFFSGSDVTGVDTVL